MATTRIVTDAMISGLPQWAQKHIENLTRHRDEANAQVQEAHAAAGFAKGEREYEFTVTPLDPTAVIRIPISDGKDGHYTIRMVGTSLEVNGSWRGLLVKPNANNDITIYLQEK